MMERILKHRIIENMYTHNFLYKKLPKFHIYMLHKTILEDLYGLEYNIPNTYMSPYIIDGIHILYSIKKRGFIKYSSVIKIIINKKQYDYTYPYNRLISKDHNNYLTKIFFIKKLRILILRELCDKY